MNTLTARRDDARCAVARHREAGGGAGDLLRGGGVVLGLGVAFFAARWIRPLLFQESATDPFIYGGVGALILVVALLIASAVPAVKGDARGSKYCAAK